MLSIRIAACLSKAAGEFRRQASAWSSQPLPASQEQHTPKRGRGEAQKGAPYYIWLAPSEKIRTFALLLSVIHPTKAPHFSNGLSKFALAAP